MASIGGITFGGTQVRYLNPGEPNTVFSVSRTLDGSLLITSLNVAAKIYRPIRIRFRFAPFSSVEALRTLGSNGVPFPFSLPDGVSGTAIIQPGSVSSKHEAWGDDAYHPQITGTAMDYYSGEVTIIQVST